VVGTSRRVDGCKARSPPPTKSSDFQATLDALKPKNSKDGGIVALSVFNCWDVSRCAVLMECSPVSSRLLWESGEKFTVSGGKSGLVSSTGAAGADCSRALVCADLSVRHSGSSGGASFGGYFGGYTFRWLTPRLRLFGRFVLAVCCSADCVQKNPSKSWTAPRILVVESFGSSGGVTTAGYLSGGFEATGRPS